MALLRQYSKHYILILSVALFLAQFSGAVHDLSHHHSADDCIICKVVETGAYDINVVEASTPIYFAFQSLHFSIQSFEYETLNYGLPFSRAPPIS